MKISTEKSGRMKEIRMMEKSWVHKCRLWQGQSSLIYKGSPLLSTDETTG